MKANLVIAITFLFSLAFASGQDRGNGGDADEVLIHSVAEQILVFLKSSQGKTIFPEVKSEDFESKMQATKISVVETDLFDLTGNRRTAINQPSTKTIFVDRRLLAPSIDNAGVLVPLVFHEFLGLLGTEVGDYLVSKKIEPYSLGILDAAKKSTSNLYFLTGTHLKAPVAIYKNSVELNQDGTFKAGVIARTMTLRTDQVQLYIYEGEKFEFEYRGFRNGGFGLEITDDRPRQAKIWSEESADWEPIGFSAAAVRNWVEFESSFQLRAMGFVPGPNFKAWKSKIAGGLVVGVPSFLNYDSAGKITSIVFNRASSDTTKGYFLMQGTSIPVDQIRYEGQGLYYVFGKHGEVGELKPLGGTKKLKFNLGMISLNDNGDIIQGNLINAKLPVRGTQYDVSYYRISFAADQAVLEDAPKYEVASTIGNVPILFSKTAADRICQQRNFLRAVENLPSKNIYFDGSLTVFDADKNDFVNLDTGTAVVLDFIKCEIVAAPYSFQADEIIY